MPATLEADTSHSARSFPRRANIMSKLDIVALVIALIGTCLLVVFAVAGGRGWAFASLAFLFVAVAQLMRSTWAIPKNHRADVPR